MGLHRSAAIALAIACGIASSDGPAQRAPRIAVTPEAAAEGLPTTFEVSVRNEGEKAIALSEVRLSLGPKTEPHPLSRHLHGAWTTPEFTRAVTIDLELAEGDIGPVARAPMPPVHVPCGPNAFVAYRFLAPATGLSLSLRAIPLVACAAEVRVEVDWIAIDALQLALLGRPVLFARSASSASLLMGEPEPGRFPGLGNASVTCQAWGAGKADGDDVLAAEEAVAGVKPQTTTSSSAIQVTAAPVPSSHAIEKAKIVAADLVEGVWLAETETWVLETVKGSVLVPKEGEPRAHAGRLAALAARMTEGGPVELSAPMDADLRADLEAAHIRTSEGKLLVVQARAKDLFSILDAIERRGLVVEEQRGVNRCR